MLTVIFRCHLELSQEGTASTTTRRETDWLLNFPTVSSWNVAHVVPLIVLYQVVPSRGKLIRVMDGAVIK